jgi:hypothetical protein
MKQRDKERLTMNRLVEITFTQALTEGNDVGYMNFATGITEKENYVIGYSAEQPTARRFTVYMNDQLLNLGDYINEADMQRLETAYFDFRTMNKSMLHLTAQLTDCFELSA